MPPKPKPVAELFWPKVDTSGDCWLWTAAIGTNGYGVFSNRALRAHRVAWELVHGPIPDGLNVLHRCDVRACVRPDHLFLGTKADNSRDAADKGRIARGTRHHHASLTEADVREIRRLVAEGLTNAEVAQQFGVPHYTVYSIKARKSWAWLQ